MKKINKLLTLFVATGGAALAAPMALTSCASQITMFDVKDGFKPTIKPAPRTRENPTTATQLYIDTVTKSPYIFVSDMIYGISQAWNSVLNQSGYKVNTFKIGVSDPTFGETLVWTMNEPDTIFPTISFSYKIQLDYTVSTNSPSTQSKQSKHVQFDLDVNYNNVIFYASEQLENGRWCIGMFDNSINREESIWPYEHSINPWSIQYKCPISVTTTKQVGTTILTNEETYNLNGKLDSAFDVIAALESSEKSEYCGIVMQEIFWIYESYYLQYVSHKPEVKLYRQLGGAQLIDDDSSRAENRYNRKSKLDVEGCNGLQILIPKSSVETYEIKSVQVLSSLNFTIDASNLDRDKTDKYVLSLERGAELFNGDQVLILPFRLNQPLLESDIDRIMDNNQRYIPFITPVRYFDVGITYTIDGVSQYDKQTVYINHNGMDVAIPDSWIPEPA